jgi:hypothetical protein
VCLFQGETTSNSRAFPERPSLKFASSRQHKPCLPECSNPRPVSKDRMTRPRNSATVERQPPASERWQVYLPHEVQEPGGKGQYEDDGVRIVCSDRVGTSYSQSEPQLQPEGPVQSQSPFILIRCDECRWMFGFGSQTMVLMEALV